MRSRYHCDRNVVVVDSGHRDFEFTPAGAVLGRRYLTRLYAKELMADAQG